MNNPNMNISQLINNLALRAADTLQPEHKIREVALQEGRESGMSGVLEMLISQLVNTGQQDINPQINEQSPIGLLADDNMMLARNQMTGDTNGNGLIDIDEWANMTIQEKSNSMRESKENKEYDEFKSKDDREQLNRRNNLVDMGNDSDSPGPDYPSDYIVQQKELERAQQEENIRRLQSEGVSFDR